MEQNDPVLTRDKPVKVYNPRNMKYSLRTWYEDVDTNCNKQKEDLDRTIRIKNDIKRVITDHNSDTRKGKENTDESIKRRMAEVEYWRQELIDIVSKLNTKNGLLKNLLKNFNKFYEKLVCQRDISKTCLSKRDFRIGIELVKDDIDIELNNEYDMLENQINDFHHFNNNVIDLLKENDSLMYQINLDIVKKFHTLQIENYIHGLNHLNDGICHENNTENFDEEQRNDYGSIPETWLRTVQDLRDNALKNIEKSGNLLNKVDDFINRSIQQSTDVWHLVNKNLLERILQVSKAHEKLTIVLNKINEGIASLKFENDKLNREISEQNRYLLLAQNRLKTRGLRVDYENCDDNANLVLKEEIRKIMCKINDLNKRHKAINDTICSLEKMKHEKELDLANKNNTLHYDKNICLVLRSKWPNGPLSTYENSDPDIL